MIDNTKNIDQYLGKYDNVFEDIIIQDVDQAKAFLVDEGLNPDEKKEERRKLINKFEFKLTALLNQERDRSLLNSAYEKLKAIIDKNIGKTEFELTNLLRVAAPTCQFRNLEKLDENGIRELLKEVDLVKLLEELDKTEDL